MKSKSMPCLNLIGRITNNKLIVRYTKHNSPYLIILLYVMDNSSANLYPVIAFKKVATRLAQEAQQGDLVSLRTILSPTYANHFFKISLIANAWSFAEHISKFSRQIPLKNKFPFIPDNYPKQKTSADTKNKDRGENNVKSDANQHISSATNMKVDIIPPSSKSIYTSQTKASSNSASNMHINPQIISENSSSQSYSASHWIAEMNKDLGVGFNKMK